MTEPELFDVIELLIDLPEYNLNSGMQGAIVDRHSDNTYEVEFADPDGETITLCTLKTCQFFVVWKAATKTWLSVEEKVAAIVNRLPEAYKQEVLEFARSLRPR